MKNQIDLIFSRLKQVEAGKVLDVATGRGEFIKLMSTSLGGFESITGIDIDPSILDIAAENFSDDRIDFREMNAYETGYPDNRFDVVSLSNSLHHFNDPLQILTEIKRILKPTGFMIINEMYCDRNQSESQKNHIMIHHWSARIDSLIKRYHSKTFTRNFIVSMISKLNLPRVEFFDYAFPVKDPRDEKIVNSLKNILAPFLDKIRNEPEYDELKKESEAIKKRLTRYGYSPASSLFVLGQK